MAVQSVELPSAGAVILWIVKHRPGITERQLSEAMYGPPRQMNDQPQPKVNQECELLERHGLLERRRDTRPMRLHLRRQA